MAISSLSDPTTMRLGPRAVSFRHSTVTKPNRGDPRNRRRAAVPWGLVGMLGLIVAIEGRVARNWLDLSDPVSLSWRFSAEAAATQAPGSDVIFLGDSLVKHGLVPTVFERATGRRAVNLSAARGPALLSYFLFRRALDAGARPSAVILNAKPAVLLGGLDYNARYWQEELSLREGAELVQMTRRVPFVVSALMGRLLPSLRSRLEIRSSLLAAVRGQTDPLPAINRVLWRNWTVNSGANVAAAHSSFQGEVAPAVEGRLHTSVFHVDPTNAEAIERFMKLAAQQKIPVFWLMSPSSPHLQDLRDQSGADSRYEQFVRAVQSRYPQGMSVLDGRRAGYPATLFVDATHLNGSGAVALSHSVATAIGLELPRSRPTTAPCWIALDSPSTRPAPSDGPLEDLEQSRRILQLQPTGQVTSR